MPKVEIIDISDSDVLQNLKDTTNVSSAPTDANKQKRPCMLEVAPTSSSVKRPRTTFHGGNNPTLHAKATTAAPKPTHTGDATGLSRSDTSSQIFTVDDEVDDKAHVRSVVSSGTASNTHLDNRGEDIVLEEVHSYPHADCFHYVSTLNRHIFCDKSAFETIQMLYSVPTRACVKGLCPNLIYASGRGTVRVEGRCGDRVSSILLRDVLYVPSVHSNLISGAQLDKAGVTATLGNGRVTLSLRGANIIDGQIFDDMYRLNMSIIRPSNAQSHPTSRFGR